MTTGNQSFKIDWHSTLVWLGILALCVIINGSVVFFVNMCLGGGS